MKLFHKHKYILDRRNEINNNDNKNKYKYKHTYICEKCKKTKIEYSKERMGY